ncbi:hypothetical protein CAPTEDRAFT_143841, partial [Capitella teleta]
KNCNELLSRGKTHSGVYSIQRDTSHDMRVYCDMETDGGGWLVIQRRKDGSQDFFLNWDDYAAGFGHLNDEFWIGFSHLLVVRGNNFNRFTAPLEPTPNKINITFYSISNLRDLPFSIVCLRIVKFAILICLAWNSMTYHNVMKFSTRDSDNDAHSTGDCAKSCKGGWWYRKCHHSNLNGLYLQVNGTFKGYNGIHWGGMKSLSYSLEFSEMKMRPLV